MERREKPTGHGKQVTLKEFIWGDPPVTEIGDFYVVKNHYPNPYGFWSAQVRGHWETKQVVGEAAAMKWALATSERVRLRYWEKRNKLIDIQENYDAGELDRAEAERLFNL